MPKYQTAFFTDHYGGPEQRQRFGKEAVGVPTQAEVREAHAPSALRIGPTPADPAAALQLPRDALGCIEHTLFAGRRIEEQEPMVRRNHHARTTNFAEPTHRSGDSVEFLLEGVGAGAIAESTVANGKHNGSKSTGNGKRPPGCPWEPPCAP